MGGAALQRAALRSAAPFLERERGAPLLFSQRSGSGSDAPFLVVERERERRSFFYVGVGAGAPLQI